MPLRVEFHTSSCHASWRRVSAPIYTFYKVWFLYGCNMILGAKSQLSLYCSYVKLSSHHIIAGLLVRSWAPILLQYATYSCLSKLSCGLVLSCVVMCCHVWSCVVMCGHVWSCVVTYYHVWSCVIMYCHMLSCVVTYYHVFSRVVMCHHVLSCG